MTRHLAFFTRDRDQFNGALVEIARTAGDFPSATTRNVRDGGETRVAVWCSNDYLGMGQHPVVLAEMKSAIDRFGAGSGGSRGLVGNNPYHVLLERELAALHHKEAALLFNSGYIANHGALTTIAGRMEGTVVFSDELNHASIIDGVRHSRADKRVFRHNDTRHLEELIAALPPERPKVIAVESVYSMSGDVAPLVEVARIAKQYGALTYVDEVHAVGMYGHEGAGIAAREGLADEFTLIMGTLGKGFGTSGGYLAGPGPIIQALRVACRAFLFTTSLPPCIAAAALASVRHLRSSNIERERLHANALLLHQLLAERRIGVLSRMSHIVPVFVGNQPDCSRASSLLLERHGTYIEPIVQPLVPRGQEMLRITPTALHDTLDIHRLANALDEIWTELGISRTTANIDRARSSAREERRPSCSSH